MSAGGGGTVTAVGQGEPEADVFGTARLRRGVLDAWTASPARFREDANAEQELALGGYRDRLVVELAQNAADAAARAGVPGRLRLTLRGDTLVAANTGAPLDAVGVESLSTLRASAKRDDRPDPYPEHAEAEAEAEAEGGGGAGAVPVGRFGVGFSAVLAVSDEPAVVGRTGGVRWSLPEARDLVAEEAQRDPADAGGLAGELRRREGHVPLLRLPLPARGEAPEGYDTAVVLPLRDAAARELVDRLLTAVDDALLLTLPGLREVVVENGDGVRTLARQPDAGGPERPGAADSARPARTAQTSRTVRIDGTRTDADGTRAHTTRRWRIARDGGLTDAELLADRPVEERLRPAWSVTWAVPVDDDGLPVRPSTEPVLHAPTPTDEPLGIPALLIGTFPLEPTRRHVAPGPLTDFLLERAADAYAALLRDWRPLVPETVDLVPGPLGKGELDGMLRQLLLGGPSGAGSGKLARVPFLAGAAEERGGGGGEEGVGDAGDGASRPVALRPRDAEIVEGAGARTVRVLAELFPGLLPAGQERRPQLRALEVPRVPLGEVIDRLAGAEREPEWWWQLYDSLAGVDPDWLTGLPVPLAGGGGRTAIGPRRVLLPLPETARAPAVGTGGGGAASDSPLDAALLSRLGLKTAHPDAAHPLLEKLGATAATPRAVLTTPQVRAAVAASLDAGDAAWDDAGGLPDGFPGGLEPEELAEAVLGLVAEAGLEPGDEPWLGALALPDDEGELAPAGSLVYPGSPFERVIRGDELASCDAELAARWGEQPLTAVGVQAGFVLVRATDVVLDPDELEPRDGDFPEPDDAGLLDAVDVWCEDVLDQLHEAGAAEPADAPGVPPVVPELLAVRDLDLVDDDHWPEALAMLARPPLRDALTAPVRVLLPGGTARTVRPYTAWWLRGHPVLDGRRPAGLRAAGGDPLLDGLYEEVDASALTTGRTRRGEPGAPGGSDGGVGDVEVLRALGVRSSAAALLDEPGGAAELLARLADPSRTVHPDRLHGLYALLADLDPDEVTLPDELRAVTAESGEARVVAAGDAAVADAPDLLPLAGDRPLLPVPHARAAALAAVLEVPGLSEVLGGGVDERRSGAGTERPVPAAVRALLPAAPATYREYDELVVDGVEVDWRRTPDGVLHAATVEGVAAGLAWAAGAWSRRFETAALLEDPDRADELARARWFE